jgi:hypothetical protein
MGCFFSPEHAAPVNEPLGGHPLSKQGWSEDNRKYHHRLDQAAAIANRVAEAKRLMEYEL